MTFFNNDHGFSAGQPGVPWGAILPDFPPMKPLCRSLRCVALVAGGTALLSGCATRPMTDGLGIEFVRIPAGGFDMGSAESVAALEAAYPGLERRRFEELSDEAPVHRVQISRPFEMSRHEVTVGQFRRFVERSGHVPESVADGTGGYGYEAGRTDGGDAFAGRSPVYSWQNPGFPQGDEHPVVNVTWNDAVALARWLSATEGRRYRLPTEAEWEYACRAGQTTRYQGGDDPRSLLRTANTFDAAAAPHWPKWSAQALPGSDGHAFTAPVGRFEPNAFGLHDMHGNVWEWVSDWHADDAYRHHTAADPTGPASGQVKVRRGGSWHSWSLYTRCAYRNWNSPTTRYTLVGIRLVREVAPTTVP